MGRPGLCAASSPDPGAATSQARSGLLQGPCVARQGRRLRNSRTTFILARFIYAYRLSQWPSHHCSTVLAETPASSALLGRLYGRQVRTQPVRAGE